MMFTRKETRTIAERIRTVAQDELGDKYLVKYKGGSYGDTLTIKLEVAQEDASGDIKDQAALDFLQLATQVGLTPEDFGGKVRLGNKWYEVIGLKPRAWKRPIIIYSPVTTKRMVTSAESIQQAKLAGGQFWRPAS